MKKYLRNIKDTQYYFEQGFLCNCSHTVSEHTFQDQFPCVDCKCIKFEKMDNLRFLKLAGKVKGEEMKEQLMLQRLVVYTVLIVSVLCVPVIYCAYKTNVINQIEKDHERYLDGFSDLEYIRAHKSKTYDDFEYYYKKCIAALDNKIAYLNLELERLDHKNNKTQEDALND